MDDCGDGGAKIKQSETQHVNKTDSFRLYTVHQIKMFN